MSETKSVFDTSHEVDISDNVKEKNKAVNNEGMQTSECVLKSAQTNMRKIKDWTGNRRTTFATLGASNHTEHDRAEYDFYATEPKAVEELLKVENFDGSVWENCCGMGHISEALIKSGYKVISTDLIDRGYGRGDIDFFKCDASLADNIVTNPPYSVALEWTEHCLDILHKGNKLALFLPIQFLESEKRIKLFRERPPVRIWVASNRLLCGINGDFTAKDKDGNIVVNKDGTTKRMSSAKCYAWFVWEIGNYNQAPTVGWINTLKSKE